MCHWFDSGSGHLFLLKNSTAVKSIELDFYQALCYNKSRGKNGLLAQAVEHLTFNQGVAGSSPA